MLYERFNLNERVQHFVLILSFTVLAITGFSLMFPYSVWTLVVVRLFGGFYLRGIIHRIAAIVFIGLCLYHLLAVLFTKRGKQEIKALLPSLTDLSDFFHTLRYFVGREKERPKFGRFSYKEKAEYWAMVWGSIVMIISGIMLWETTQTIGLFTKLGYDIAKVIHGFEAILAGLALIVWHFYGVHFNPEDFPFKNLTWLNGKISPEKMSKEHPLELEQLTKEEKGQIS